MTYFQNNEKHLNELKKKIKIIVWEEWEQYWKKDEEKTKHLNELIRHILNIFDYVSRYWGIENPNAVSEVEKAILFAIKAHSSQKPRKTGEPYISHPLTVASSCAQYGMDLPTIIAAVLHDTIEDTDITKNDIIQAFGNDVASIVDGLSKVKSKDKGLIDRDKVATFFKIFESSDFKDNLLRTIIIKIMDRKDNMKTVGVFRQTKQIRYASETINIYASLATILGMRYIATDLFGKSMESYFSDEYSIIKTKTNQRMAIYASNEYALQNILRQITYKKLNIKFIQFFPTVVDHLNLETKKLNYENPPLRLRLRVPSVSDMYTLLGLIQNYNDDPLISNQNPKFQNFQVLHDTWKDYVASPLANGYRALTIQIKFNDYIWLLEILSVDMEDIVDWGILSNFGNKNLRDFYITGLNAFRDNLSNISNMRYNDLQAITASAVAAIRVRYKNGDIIQLPKNSIVLDLAYIIDEDLGLYCSKALINGKICEPTQQLHHGEHIEIITQKKPSIKETYFYAMKSHIAKEKYKKSVQKYFMRIAYERGKEICLQFININKLDKKTFFDSNNEPIFCSQEDIINIGLAKYTVMDVLSSHGYDLPSNGFFSSHSLQISREITDYNDLIYSYPTCCNVFPVIDTDVVMQYSPSSNTNTGLGLIELHYSSCPHLDENRPQIEVEWNIDFPSRLPLLIKAENKVGLIGKITGIIAKHHLSILFMKVDVFSSKEEEVIIQITIDLKQGEHRKLSIKHLTNCIKSIRKNKSVKQINIITE